MDSDWLDWYWNQLGCKSPLRFGQKESCYIVITEYGVQVSNDNIETAALLLCLWSLVSISLGSSELGTVGW
jgi:hypothetical protein